MKRKGSTLIKPTIFKALLCFKTNFPLKSVFNPILPSLNECHQTTSQFMTLRPGTIKVLATPFTFSPQVLGFLP